MTSDKNEPTAASLLAAMVMGSASIGGVVASVQRSHRFPLPEFIQIENLARMSEVSVSQIINQLIECGLDAVKSKLPDEVVREMTIDRRGTSNRKTVVAVQGPKKKSRPAKTSKGKD
ncbi:hypothetical protein [Propionivibrio dicarboxylicus]|uniref:Uncharacterized protein n=1 Tax=Propionivibrio dicarboxylicus TaxID=83767 RepID=A0A1G7WMH6_9RHOO|nr:hypothetical protein [Propionivibrio dicarboxylicus]SDG73116.1 hypothetical protein SAMN05660652_00570 [Propionivibrio dicarboxylicus]